MTPWLSIVGVGEDGLDGLGRSARTLVERAEVLVGGERHLAMVPLGAAERLTWATPLSDTMAAVVARRGRRVVVLATGDPFCYGVGVTLARHVPIAETVVVPSAGCVGLVCARLGWPSAEVEVVTLHGRPIALLAASARPGARLIVLSHDGTTPAKIADWFAARGFGDSRFVVLERLGGASEHVAEATAATWRGNPHDLNTVAVECRLAPGAAWRPRTPGLPDDAFEHDGQITKREVRAVTLARLMPEPQGLLWDVGAGSGSIAIEWLRAEPTARAVAIERDADRVARILRNASSLGVSRRLEIVTGEAPEALADLDAPAAAFIGGGTGDDRVLGRCWEALRPGGRLVANAVTVAGEAALLARHTALGGDLTRLSVSRAEPLAGGAAWRALRPVMQWATVKP
ncbi:MAG: precorrin-6y C5,15-methyltransferase (decarboxylating) subunit CbiE [Alphaproteobacteria bacterium]|nr:precorrin-6y C5,15-methyltransferase (decarboxylating) subunit CbiE [Alphaproteobacteria bacterium]